MVLLGRLLPSSSAPTRVVGFVYLETSSAIPLQRTERHRSIRKVCVIAFHTDEGQCPRPVSAACYSSTKLSTARCRVHMSRRHTCSASFVIAFARGELLHETGPLHDRVERNKKRHVGAGLGIRNRLAFVTHETSDDGWSVSRGDNGIVNGRTAGDGRGVRRPRRHDVGPLCPTPATTYHAKRLNA